MMRRISISIILILKIYCKRVFIGIQDNLKRYRRVDVLLIFPMTVMEQGYFEPIFWGIVTIQKGKGLLDFKKVRLVRIIIVGVGRSVTLEVNVQVMDINSLIILDLKISIIIRIKITEKIFHLLQNYFIIVFLVVIDAIKDLRIYKLINDVTM